MDKYKQLRVALTLGGERMNRNVLSYEARIRGIDLDDLVTSYRADKHALTEDQQRIAAYVIGEQLLKANTQIFRKPVMEARQQERAAIQERQKRSYFGFFKRLFSYA